MAEASPDPHFFRTQIERIRRLLADVTDKQARRALMELAKEYEAREADAKRAKLPRSG